MRTLAEVLTMEEPYERLTLTEFVRAANPSEDGKVWATLSCGSSSIGAPLDAVPSSWSPPTGSAVLLWGKGFGYVVRGIAVDDVLLFYRTAEEEDAEHTQDIANFERKQVAEFELEGKAKLDADYAALPAVFQARIDKIPAQQSRVSVEVRELRNVLLHRGREAGPALRHRRRGRALRVAHAMQHRRRKGPLVPRVGRTESDRSRRRFV